MYYWLQLEISLDLLIINVIFIDKRVKPSTQLNQFTQHLVRQRFDGSGSDFLFFADREPDPVRTNPKVDQFNN